jgi:multiple sugar transport system ATP-binding protein
MQGGVLQQLGTPLEVYNRPVNVFVAKFLGSPSMNFVPCELTVEGGITALTAPNFRYPLDGAARALGEGAPGGQVILGVRPEDVRISTTGDAGGVACQVELLEPMGSLNIVYATTGTDRLIATTEPGYIVEPGQPVWLHFDETKLHLFDRATERNLLAASPRTS